MAEIAIWGRPRPEPKDATGSGGSSLSLSINIAERIKVISVAAIYTERFDLEALYLRSLGLATPRLLPLLNCYSTRDNKKRRFWL